MFYLFEKLFFLLKSLPKIRKKFHNQAVIAHFIYLSKVIFYKKPFRKRCHNFRVDFFYSVSLKLEFIFLKLENIKIILTNCVCV